MIDPMSSALAPSGIGRDADGSQAPEIRETHTGLVVLVGDRAYKAKKSVVTEFLDFSTVERREEACQREVRLNGRLSADSYLGVAHLVDPENTEPEPVVVMRRYPDSIRLASMVRRGEPVEHHLSAIAEKLASFHAMAARGPNVDACGTAAAIKARWRQNVAELVHVSTGLVDPLVVAEIDRLAGQYVDGRAGLFARRIVELRVVDGHGDLIADDVFCPGTGPVLLDCLEFDDRLRFVDGLDDAAFLAMDLEFLGNPSLAEFFLGEYRRFAGDSAPMSLAHFYIAYRAVVRAKVDCIRVSQGDAGARAGVRRHLDLALQHLRTGTVRLVLVGGGPGTGKTTLANALADRTAAQVVSSDDVRREMHADGDLDGVAGVYGAGLYTADNVDAVYDALLHRAGALLTGGQSVILDATWRELRHRVKAREVANATKSPIVELACTVPIDVATARILDRRNSSSDATPDIASAMCREETSWEGAHFVDTSRPLGDTTAEAHQICCLAT